MAYADEVNSILVNEIQQMAQTATEYSIKPTQYYTRNRKISFFQLLHLPICMEGGTIQKELYKYFKYDSDTISASAFCQQRDKLASDVFKKLFINFNKHFKASKYRNKYRLLACDGASFTFTRNPSDIESYYDKNEKSPNGYNQIHVVALYDIISQRYTNAVIQPARCKNEFKALTQMIDETDMTDSIPVFIADRGFQSYNCFAHAMQKHACFLIRCKDKNLARMLDVSLEDIPDYLDITINRIITRTQSPKKQRFPGSQDYRYICNNVRFDFIPLGSFDEYPMELRVVRFELSDGNYESLITNLPREEFSVTDLKELYSLRWGIEVSFRELKYIIGAERFHSKKRLYIEQEVWARLILYNYCSVITTNVVTSKKTTKYTYQVNYTIAYGTCHYHLRNCFLNTEKIDVEKIINKHMLPIRLNRNYPRRKRFMPPVSFTYRIA